MSEGNSNMTIAFYLHVKCQRKFFVPLITGTDEVKYDGGFLITKQIYI